MWKWQRAVAKDTKGKAFQINKPMGLTMEEVEKRLPVIMPDITKLECPPAGRIQATCKCATSVQTCGLKRGRKWCSMHYSDSTDVGDYLHVPELGINIIYIYMYQDCRTTTSRSSY